MLGTNCIVPYLLPIFVIWNSVLSSLKTFNKSCYFIETISVTQVPFKVCKCCLFYLCINTLKLPYNELPFYKILCLTKYLKELWASSFILPFYEFFLLLIRLRCMEVSLYFTIDAQLLVSYYFVWIMFQIM